MGYKFISYDNGEDIILSLKKDEIIKFVDGKQNINVRIYRGAVSSILPKKYKPIRIRRSINTKLTLREFEVLKLMVQGKNNIVIANELCVSRHTVKAHVANILQKLNVNDRLEAVIKVITEKIV